MVATNTTATARPFEQYDAEAGDRRVHPVRRLLLPIIVLTALLSQVLASAGNSTISWVSAIVFASFLLVLCGPVWALAPIVINEMTLAGFTNPMFGFSQRFVIAGLAIVFGITTISKTRLFSDRRMRRVLLPGIAFVLIVFVMNLQHSDELYVYQYLRYQLLQIATLVLVACLIRRVEELKQLATVALVVTTAMAIIVIWQHYAPTTAIYGVREGIAKGRAVGLDNSPVGIATQLIFMLAPMLGVLASIRFRWNRRYLFLLGATMLTAIALNFTYTRSAVFALAPAVVVMALMFGGRRRLMLIAAVIIGVVLFFALENTGYIGERYYENAEDDQSAATHDALLDVSLAIALDNPLSGIGHDQFTTVAPEYVDAVGDDTFTYGGASALGEQQPHNDFLNAWLSWGIFALIAFVGIFLGTFWNFVIGSRHPDPFVRGLAIGCAGGLVNYSVNSMFHNSLDSSLSLWMYAGLSVVLARLARQATTPSDGQPATTPMGANG